MTRTMNPHYVFCINATSQVRRVAHAGREYVVAPVVAIRAGVLNGEMVPGEEIGRYPEAWNGIPVVMGHPMERGVYVSANTPDIVAGAPGRFWYADVSDGQRLRGEIWMDVALCESLGGDALEALQRLERGEAVEVSTAYWRDLEETPGELYYGVARNLRPDHLALLLHEMGACSWADGCGTPRVNVAGDTAQAVAQRLLKGEFESETEVEANMSNRTIQVNYELSLDGLRSKVYDAWQAKFRPEGGEPEGPYMWVREMFADKVIVDGDPRGLTAYPYTMGSNGVVSFGAPVLVQIEYVPVAAGQDDGGRNAVLAFIEMLKNLVGQQRRPCGCEDQPADGEQPTANASDVPDAPGGLATLAADGEEIPFVGLGEQAADSGQPTAEASDASSAPGGLAAQAGQGEQAQDQTAGSGQPAPSAGSTPISNCEMAAQAEQGENTPGEQAADGEQPATEAGDAPSTPGGLAAQAEQGEQTQTDGQATEVGEIVALVRELGGIDALRKALTAQAGQACEERTQLIAALSANERCAFNRAELEAMETGSLRKLAASLATDYSGRGTPRAAGEAEQGETPLPMPALF